MALVAEVLGVSPLPVVRLEVSGLATGSEWVLSGSAGGESWPVAQGVLWGSDAAVVADPWAPLNVETSYTLRYLDAGSGLSRSESAGPVTRVFRGRSAITDLSGRVVVSFNWTAAGGDPWEQEPRVSFFDAPGSLLPAPWFAPTAGAGGGGLVARTTGADTAGLRGLVRANRPVILLHNEALCQVPGCDVPAVRTVSLTRASEDRTARTDVAEREWSLSYRPVPVPHGFRGPVVSVGDLAGAFSTVGDLASSGMTVGAVARGDWAVSGLVASLRAGEYVRGGGGDWSRTSEGEWADGPVGTFVPTGVTGEYTIKGAS